MNIRILRRRLKSRVETVSKPAGRPKISIVAVSFSTLLIVLLVFCIFQLTIVSILSPHGAVLVNLNSEKDALIEENRILSQKIAERVALSVVSSRAENDLSMERADTVMYLQKPSVSAEASVAQ